MKVNRIVALCIPLGRACHAWEAEEKKQDIYVVKVEIWMVQARVSH